MSPLRKYSHIYYFSKGVYGTVCSFETHFSGMTGWMNGFTVFKKQKLTTISINTSASNNSNGKNTIMKYYTFILLIK